jgi:dipeptidyl aminopeptidase/acylaminoacyl peptidase
MNAVRDQQDGGAGRWAPGAALIPRRTLFGNPDRTQARISPDGRWLSWLAPRDGVLNMWAAPTGDVGAARCLTGDRKSGIHQHFWPYDSRYLLYLQDRDGDENWNIHAVELASGAARNLTPLDGVHAIVHGVSPDRPGTVAVGLNDRDARWHDIYEIDIATGERRLVLRNDEELVGFVLDRRLTIRLATRTLPGGDQLVLRNDGSSFKEMLRIPQEDSMGTSLFAFNAAGDAVFAFSSIGRDKTALLKIDWASGRQTVLAEHDKADISQVLMDPATDEVEAAAATHQRLEWIPLAGAQAVGADLGFLARQLKGEIQIASQSVDNKRWLVESSRAEEPGRYYLFDRTARSVEELFSTRPELAEAPLQPMHPVVLRSRDQLELVSYLTLPETGSDGTRPRSPLPMVLLVHGGPWWRSVYDFNSLHQWLADRGYAVLDVNFRGSTGFGKAFVNAGDREWGGKMHDDLVDAVRWAIAEGIADPTRIAIMGQSYGGYATLVGLTFTPDLFCCGVERVGPSNLETMLATSPPHWAAFFEDECRRVGDPRTEEGRALLRDRSPLHRVRSITKPLLIAQGANDIRVKQAESEQIVAAMKDNRLPVTYLLYSDEGHGLERPENRLSWYATVESFLASHLGGRSEPIGGDLVGASLEAREGAAHVPGLEEALDAADGRSRFQGEAGGGPKQQ